MIILLTININNSSYTIAYYWTTPKQIGSKGDPIQGSETNVPIIAKADGLLERKNESTAS